MTSPYRFFLRFNVPVNNFSVLLGRSHRFLGIFYQCFSGSKCVFAQGHNTAEVGIEPRPLTPESEALPLCRRAPKRPYRVKPFKIFFSGTIGSIFTKLGMRHWP